jgi:hypothetical protein
MYYGLVELATGIVVSNIPRRPKLLEDPQGVSLALIRLSNKEAADELSKPFMALLVEAKCQRGMPDNLNSVNQIIQWKYSLIHLCCESCLQWVLSQSNMEVHAYRGIHPAISALHALS